MRQTASNPSKTGSTTDPSLAELRVCTHCHARYPLSHYGLFRHDSKGYAKVCKACRAEISRNRWTRKFGRKRPIDVGPTRGVLHHNRAILGSAIQAGKLEFRGFCTDSKMEYKVFYGPTERTGLMSLTIFNRSGDMFIEYALSGVRDPIEAFASYVKVHHIRLELTDLDVIQSKTQIYHF